MSRDINRRTCGYVSVNALDSCIVRAADRPPQITTNSIKAAPTAAAATPRDISARNPEDATPLGEGDKPAVLDGVGVEDNVTIYGFDDDPDDSAAGDGDGADVSLKDEEENEDSEWYMENMGLSLSEFPSTEFDVSLCPATHAYVAAIKGGCTYGRQSSSAHLGHRDRRH